MSFDNTGITGTTLRPCSVQYLQNTIFTDAKPNSSMCKVTKADEDFSAFSCKKWKVTLSKINAACIAYKFLMKDGDFC